jgi:ketohexokinase
MTRILGIGIATLDIINTVDGFPSENSEVRATGQRIARGGNGTNLLVVLSQLGHTCAWGGVYTQEPDSRYILEDLRRYHIDVSGCRKTSRGKMPTSYVLLNSRNGSRTIVHYRDLPEFSYADFTEIDLASFDWIHFEGRNVDETRKMLDRARAEYPAIPLSVEVEKPRKDIETLFAGADLLLFSRVYALAHGFSAAQALFAAVRAQAPCAALVCGWGEAGAYALGQDGKVYFSPAFRPPQQIDTLGAGDTLNAGIVNGVIRGQSLQTVLEDACHLAGRKCGQLGFAELV